MSAEEEHDTNATTAGDDGAIVGGEEHSTAEYTPVVRLEQVHVATGEEDDTELYKQRAALYRFSQDTKEWKERGRGDLKLLQNKSTHLIRILMRQDKTLKVCLNHVVNPLIELQANAGSDRSWVWRSTDYSDPDDVTDQTFAIRFSNSEIAQVFKDKFDEVKKQNEATLNGKSTTKSTDSTSPATDSSQPTDTATAEPVVERKETEQSSDPTA